VNIEDIKRANSEAGYHWFSPETLRFFDSRIGETVYGVWNGSGSDRKPGGQYFITSERQGHEYPRLYSVRRYNPETHGVDTIGNFGEYRTSQGAAKRAIRERDREQQTGEWEGKPEDADRNTRVDGGRLEPDGGYEGDGQVLIAGVLYDEATGHEVDDECGEDGEGLGLYRPSYGD
jgi:hypothetical protein